MNPVRGQFSPLLFGGDINVYSVARAFHEAYGVKSTVFAKYSSGPCCGSKIIDYRVCERNDDPEEILARVSAFARERAGHTIFVLGCGDNYITAIASKRDEFPPNVVAPYISSELMQILIHKERFYELCEQYHMDYPKTFVCRKEMGHDFVIPFPPPYVVKAAESVAYWEHSFPEQKKAYVAQTQEEALSILDNIYNAGYQDSVIIQDFIPGDDSYMRVLTGYSDRNGKVKLMCLGHVLLEEHTPKAIGNHALILTEDDEALCLRWKGFLEGLRYTGFFNLDMKLDLRDGKMRAFEINCRQGRSNYYVTASGGNIAEILVRDYLSEAELRFSIAKEKRLWRVIPRDVCFDYTPKAYHAELRALIRNGQEAVPLSYPADWSIKRILYLLKDANRQRKQYKMYLKKPE